MDKNKRQKRFLQKDRHIERQFDICQRCHLQGNMVLAEGASYYDFKPGMTLSNYITVFLPRYSNADQSFIMASHADRLKQSPCFIQSLRNADPNALKPYKNALTCVSCSIRIMSASLRFSLSS